MNEVSPTITSVTKNAEAGAHSIDGELLELTAGESASRSNATDGTSNAGVGAVQEKLNEYKVLVAPVEQAIRELQYARGMLRARAEDEINALSPALSALAETLGISTLDLLTSANRAQFLQDAVERADVPVDEVRRRIASAIQDVPPAHGTQIDGVRDLIRQDGQTRI
jgi:hypothetical protein